MEAKVDDKWYYVKECFVEAFDRVCGWTKEPVRYQETWWWNDKVGDAIKEKNGNSGKDVVGRKFIWKQNERQDWKLMLLTNRLRKRFQNILRRDDEKDKLFKNEKQMARTNPDVGEK